MAFLDSYIKALSMAGNHSSRVVDNTQCDDYTIDTCEVYDRPYRYETAISHTHFNEGRWIVVGSAKDRKAAQMVHDYWVHYLESENLYELHTPIEDVWEHEPRPWHEHRAEVQR